VLNPEGGTAVRSAVPAVLPAVNVAGAVSVPGAKVTLGVIVPTLLLELVRVTLGELPPRTGWNSAKFREASRRAEETEIGTELPTFNVKFAPKPLGLDKTNAEGVRVTVPVPLPKPCELAVIVTVPLRSRACAYTICDAAPAANEIVTDPLPASD